MPNTFDALSQSGVSMKRLSWLRHPVLGPIVVIGALIAVLAVGWMASVASWNAAVGPLPVHGTRRIGALDSTLESVSRQGGVLAVVVSVTNSSDASQPIALRRWTSGSTESSPVVPNRLGLEDASNALVEPTGTPYAAAGEPAAVSGGPPTHAPEMISPHGRIEIKQSFVDPGPGAILFWNPLGDAVDVALDRPNASWRLP